MRKAMKGAGRLPVCMLCMIVGMGFGPGVAKGAPSTVDSASTSSVVDQLLDAARRTHDSTQAVVVTARSADSPRASLTAYSYEAGHWKKVIGPFGAVLGKAGISLHKREGDMKSPAGMFPIGRGFGSASKPAGVTLPFTQTTDHDYWVDDTGSKDYNQWETYAGDPDTKWKSYERLRIPAYQYAAVIRYNVDPIRKGQGSAIFFHIWPGPDGHTSGCTATSKPHVLEVLRWADPERHPVIIQGTKQQLQTLAKREAAP